MLSEQLPIWLDKLHKQKISLNNKETQTGNISTTYARYNNNRDIPAILSEFILVEPITYEAVVVAAVSRASVDCDADQLILTAGVTVSLFC